MRATVSTDQYHNTWPYCADAISRILGTYGKITGETSVWFKNVVHVFINPIHSLKKIIIISLYNVNDWFYITERLSESCPVKVKVQFTLEQATKVQRGSRGIAPLFLLGGGWSTRRPGRFTPRERPDTHCTGGWVGPRAGLDGCGKSRSPDLPARSESLYRMSYPGPFLRGTSWIFKHH